MSEKFEHRLGWHADRIYSGQIGRLEEAMNNEASILNKNERATGAPTGVEGTVRKSGPEEWF